MTYGPFQRNCNTIEVTHGKERGQTPFVRSTLRAVPAKGVFPFSSGIPPSPYGKAPRTRLPPPRVRLVGESEKSHELVAGRPVCSAKRGSEDPHSLDCERYARIPFCIFGDVAGGSGGFVAWPNQAKTIGLAIPKAVAADGGKLGYDYRAGSLRGVSSGFAYPTSTLQSGGLGLGLAISRAIVVMHGGGIEARSEGRLRWRLRSGCDSR